MGCDDNVNNPPSANGPTSSQSGAGASPDVPRRNFGLLLFVVLMIAGPVGVFSMIEYQNFRAMISPSEKIDPATVYLMQMVRADDQLDSVSQAPEASVDRKRTSGQLFSDLQPDTFMRVLLEVKLMSDVSRQIEASLLSRAWLRFTTILFGGICLIVGAVFILGNVQTGRANMEANFRDEFSVQFAANSPGLFLVLFGTALILTSGAFDKPIKSTRPATYILGASGSPDVAETDNLSNRVAEGSLINDGDDEARKNGQFLEGFE